jgi:Cu(I)/Ag(I) efflux system membrane fusion protein
MQRLSLFLALVVGLAVGIASTWWFARRVDGGASLAVKATASIEKKALYWYDPMVPNQHFDQPGKSPFMDMQLVPKYADVAGDAEGAVSIDARLVQNLGVRTVRATRRALAAPVRATGTVAFDERAITLVQARVAGIIEHLAVRAPLTAVTQGQPLITLIAPDWTAAQGEYLALRQSRSTGLETLRAAARERLLLLGMGESQIRAIERSGHAQDRITLTAPRTGIVAELMVREGASVTAGAPLMRINGLDTIWINAAIPEAQAGRVASGAKVDIELPAFPGEKREGTIEAVLPDLDPTTRTQTARVVVPNPLHRLAPGMFARLQIATPKTMPAPILIPTEAVIATGTRSVVIVDVGDGRFRAQEVRIGEEANGQTIVLEGMEEGASVVLSGQFLIDSEASLMGTLARLDGPATPATSTSIAPVQHTTDGTLERIDGPTWTIATDAIPSLQMGAMTMTFVRPDNLPLDGIKPGQRIRFSFIRNADGDFEIVAVAATRHDGEIP